MCRIGVVKRQTNKTLILHFATPRLQILKLRSLHSEGIIIVCACTGTEFRYLLSRVIAKRWWFVSLLLFLHKTFIFRQMKRLVFSTNMPLGLYQNSVWLEMCLYFCFVLLTCKESLIILYLWVAYSNRCGVLPFIWNDAYLNVLRTC